MTPWPAVAFWSLLVATGFLIGWAAGARRAYRHGFEDALELIESDPSPILSGGSDLPFHPPYRVVDGMEGLKGP